VGFIMDGLDAEAYDRIYSDRQLVRRIWGYFRPALKVMTLVAALIALNSLADIVFPVLISRGIDTLTAGATAAQGATLIGAILIAGMLSWTFNFIRQWQTARAVGDVVLRLRQDAFDAVMARDLSFYDEFPSGKIVSRVTSDTEDFANVVTLTLNLLSQIVLVVLIMGVLLVLNVTLALVALAFAPVIVVLALAFRQVARRTTQRSRRALATVNALVQETIGGISVAKNFRQEQTIYDEFAAVNRQTYRVSLRQGFTLESIFPILNTISGIGTALIVYYGGIRTIDHAISPGTWYLFVQAIAIFWFPLTSISSFWSQFQQGLASSERVFALIDADPRVRQSADRQVQRLAGSIDFVDVDFRYTDQQAVLERFSLGVPAGKTLAIVGHTGAGKSSLVKLIARFYEFQSGRILIDGHDIRTLDLAAYRRQLGIVPQIPFLFSGTVADNIRYARPEASDDDVAEAAWHIGGGDWIDALPQGLQTDVGESGKALSLGQRQLVALARVLLQDPAIIILDEATASVDPLTEAQIQEGLEVVLRDRTALVIAHRLSTVRHADRIIVMRKGQIVEDGNHETLLAQGGEYADLYNTYFRSQDPYYEPGEGFVPIKER
jgi:ATP-binding cassette subfamily B protein